MTQPFTHKATAVNAIQFDGTIDTLVTIIETVTPSEGRAEVGVHIESGVIQSANINADGVYLGFQNGEWVVMYDDDRSPAVVSDADFTRDWQS